MARNLNQIIPRYVESDLNKSKLAKPPRIKSKETIVYIYETDKNVVDIEKNQVNIRVSTKFSFQLDIQITSPLNFDISSPKFSSLSDSGVWGSQINGFIFEDINLDTSKYNYVTFNLETQQTIKNSQKYRIISINKKYNTQNKFLYSTIILAPDSVVTIPSLQRITWQLVAKFQQNVKTKYLKLKFDYRTIFFESAIRISIDPEIGSISRNDGFTITGLNTTKFYGGTGGLPLLASPMLNLKFIKIRNVNPLQIDDMTLEDINVNRNNMGTALASSQQQTQNNAFSTIQELSVEYNSNGNVMRTKNQIDYFSYGLDVKTTKTTFKLKERSLSNQGLNSFFNGTFKIDNYLIEKSNPLTIETTTKNLDDLKIDNKDDRLFFVLTAPSDLKKYIIESSSTTDVPLSSAIVEIKDIGAISPYPKTRYITSEEWGKNFLLPSSSIGSSSEEIVLDLTLQVAGFNPKIVIDTLIAKNVKITQYDDKHRIIGIPDLNFQTEFVFDDSKTTTIIQL